MRQGKYLNVILTVNAALLGGLLWVQVAGGPGMGHELQFVAQASAQAPPSDGGIPNAASQRQKMIESLREIKSSVDSMRSAIEGGKLRVQVTNLSEIKTEGK